MNRIKSGLVALVTLVGLLFSTSPAEAAHTHYGESARHVAKEINCHHFDHKAAGVYNLDGGVCYLKGHRVNVLTFKGPGKQGDWNTAAKSSLPSDFYWGNGKGAVVVAKNGNHTAARIGANRLPGVVRHG